MQRACIPVVMWLCGLLSAGVCAALEPPSNRVSSAERPRLELQIAERFSEVPPLQFPIADLTDAERRVFVDAGDDKAIDDMVIVQFEKVKAGSDFRFVFPSTPPKRFGAETYRFGTFAYDDVLAAKTAPDREAARTRAHLSSLGYVLPEVWQVARLARVSDPDGLSEVIVFYMRAASRPAQPVDEDGGWRVSAEEAVQLERALEAAVMVVDG